MQLTGLEHELIYDGTFDIDSVIANERCIFILLDEQVISVANLSSIIHEIPNRRKLREWVFSVLCVWR